MKRIAFSLLCALPLAAFSAEKEKPIPGESEFNLLLLKRHSGYSYDSKRNVPWNYLNRLAMAARRAPSSYNEQPWRYIFCDRVRTPEAYQKLLKSLVPSNQKWAQNAPVLVAVTTKTDFTRNGSPNSVAQYDAGAASMAMVLEATALGLMAHQMAGFEAEMIQSEFSVPEGFIPVAVIAIGYESTDAELSSTDRNPIEQNFFLGEWDKGFNIR